MELPVEINEKGFFINVRLSPNSKTNDIKEVIKDENGKLVLKASVTAIAEKNKANKALIKMLSKKLKIAKSNFSIISGQTDKNKRIKIEALEKKDYDELLNKIRRIL